MRPRREPGLDPARRQSAGRPAAGMTIEDGADRGLIDVAEHLGLGEARLQAALRDDRSEVEQGPGRSRDAQGVPVDPVASRRAAR